MPRDEVIRALREILQRLLSEPDEEAMANAVGSLLSDRRYQRQLGAQARRLVVDRWSIDAATDRLERRLAEVLTSGLA